MAGLSSGLNRSGQNRGQLLDVCQNVAWRMPMGVTQSAERGLGSRCFIWEARPSRCAPSAFGAPLTSVNFRRLLLVGVEGLEHGVVAEILGIHAAAPPA